MTRLLRLRCNSRGFGTCTFRWGFPSDVSVAGSVVTFVVGDSPLVFVSLVELSPLSWGFHSPWVFVSLVALSPLSLGILSPLMFVSLVALSHL